MRSRRTTLKQEQHDQFNSKWNSDTQRKHAALSTLINVGPRYVFFLSLEH